MVMYDFTKIVTNEQIYKRFGSKVKQYKICIMFFAKTPRTPPLPHNQHHQKIIICLVNILKICFPRVSENEERIRMSWPTLDRGNNIIKANK